MKQFNKKIKMFGLLFCLITSSAFAQTRVTGRVTDSTNGDAIIGASVLEKGTTNGAITDFDGNFTVTVSDPNGVLTVNYTGYGSVDVPLVGRARVDISIAEDAGLLEEIVEAHGRGRLGSALLASAYVRTADVISIN